MAAPVVVAVEVGAAGGAEGDEGREGEEGRGAVLVPAAAGAAGGAAGGGVGVGTGGCCQGERCIFRGMRRPWRCRGVEGAWARGRAGGRGGRRWWWWMMGPGSVG